MNEPSILAIPSDRRAVAMLTHLSGLAGYLIPLGGVVVPIVIWAVKSDDRVVSAIARQALLLNVVVFVLAGALFLLFLTVLLIPVAVLGWIVLAFAAVVLPIVGAVKASGGEYFRYPLIGMNP